MALTPEDVVNKRFQPTKFREGYDQDEVDDFLDEVVVELRRLNQENEELRQRLVASDSRISELQRSGAQQQAPQGFAAPAPASVPAPEPFAAPAPAAAAPYSAPAPAENPLDPGNTNNLLQLARRLHEEHVREGVEKRDALIAEGHATASRLVQEAETTSRQQLQDAETTSRQQLQDAEQAARQQLQDAENTSRQQLQEAEQASRAQIGSLEQERSQLESRIEELRVFEREYREKLKGYIEGQLRELDNVNILSSATATSAPAPSYAAPAAPPAAFPGFAGN